MVTDAYYFVIRSKKSLIDRINAMSGNSDFTILVQTLAEKTIWHKRLGKSAEEADTYAPFVKLAFLADLLEDAQDSLNSDYRDFVHELLGAPPYAITAFDKWWEMECLRANPVDLDLSYGRLQPDTLAMFASTGITELDNWLQTALKDRAAG